MIFQQPTKELKCVMNVNIQPKKKDDEKREYTKIGKEKYKEFEKIIQSISIELVPIKILKNNKYKENKYGSKWGVDHRLFNIEKNKNRWYINKNAVDLFFNLGLDEFYCFSKRFTV